MLTEPAVAALRKAGKQAFLFFPPVRGIATNRWRFGEVTRIEFSAVNDESGEVVWFSRGNISYVTIEAGGITLALRRELRYSGGAVWPVQEEAASEPESAGDSQAPAPAAEGEEASAAADEAEAIPAVAPARARAKQPRAGLFNEPVSLVLAVVGGAALVLVLVLAGARAWLQPSPKGDDAPITDASLYTLTAEDNYNDVVRKIGAPASERSLTAGGGDLVHQALIYRERNYAVVLMGVQAGATYSQEPRYIGAVRLSDGAVVASVNLSHELRTDALLKVAGRQLKSGK